MSRWIYLMNGKETCKVDRFVGYEDGCDLSEEYTEAELSVGFECDEFISVDYLNGKKGSQTISYLKKAAKKNPEQDWIGLLLDWALRHPKAHWLVDDICGAFFS